MRTWITILVIASMLCALSVAEIVIVDNFCKNVEKIVSDVCYKTKNGTPSVDDLDKLSDVWQKNKTAVFALSNHHMFSDYEDSIAEMYYYYKSDEREKLYHTAVTLENINKRLKGAISFEIGNIF